MCGKYFIVIKVLNLNDALFANDFITYKDIKKKICKTTGRFEEYVKELTKNWLNYQIAIGRRQYMKLKVSVLMQKYQRKEK